MTKAQEERAINGAKEAIQDKFIEQFGFAPNKSQIIPLEASFKGDKFFEKYMYYCDSLGFRVGRIGYSYRINEGLQRNDAYDA